MVAAYVATRLVSYAKHTPLKFGISHTTLYSTIIVDTFNNGKKAYGIISIYILCLYVILLFEPSSATLARHCVQRAYWVLKCTQELINNAGGCNIGYIILLTIIYGDCPMFRRFYVQKVLRSENICSKGSMFRRFYIQKVLCSEGPIFRRFYIQKVLCSEGPMFKKYLFKRSYIQKVLCSEGHIFRIFFVWCRKKLTSFRFR